MGLCRVPPLMPGLRAPGPGRSQPLLPAAPQCPRTGAFWSSAPPAPERLSPGRCSTSAPQQPGRPKLSPRLSPLPGRGSTGWGWGGPIGLGLSVCVRVAPGPKGPLYRDALPAGLCTYCKKQLFESCCFGFCFLPPDPPLYPAGKEVLAGLGPGLGAGSVVAPACSRCLPFFFFFSSTLRCLWKETGPRGLARSWGTGWVKSPGWGLEGSG